MATARAHLRRDLLAVEAHEQGRTPRPVALQLQRAAGNAATAALLADSGAGAVASRAGAASGPVVQRRLQMSGTPRDVATTLRLLSGPSGLLLDHDRRTKLVGARAAPGATATSPALAAQLRTIIDDPARTAQVRVGPAVDEGKQIGAFPTNDAEPVQEVFIDQVVSLEQAVPGAGTAKLAHEITENYVAQPLIAEGGAGDYAFGPSHAAALKVENKVFAELQAAAGGPRSGTRLRDYFIAVRDPAGKGSRILRAETHEHDFILYEDVRSRGARRLRVERDPGTTVQTWELVGFGRGLGLPTGSGRVLAEIARHLVADPTAAVIMEATSLAWFGDAAPQWLDDVAAGIKARMAGADDVLRYSGRFSPHPTTTFGDVNQVRIVLRRPTSIPRG